MSFTPRNVSQLIVANTSTANLAAYKVAKAAKTTGSYLIQAKPDPNTASGKLANLGAQIIAVSVNGNDVVSEFVAAKDIDKITASTVAAGTNKTVTATYTAPADFINKSFYITLDLNDHIGSMLNDRFISAYVACDAAGKFVNSAGVLTVGTINAVVAELATLLSSTITKQSENFTVSSAANVITIVQGVEPHIVGVKDGVANPFTVTGGLKVDTTVGGTFSNEPAAIAITVAGKTADLVQLKNIEWFNSGYSKDPYRETGYPYSFPVAKNIEAAAIAVGAPVVIIQFHKDRDATNVERQHRQLILVGTGATAFKTALEALTA